MHKDYKRREYIQLNFQLDVDNQIKKLQGIAKNSK